MPKQDAPKQKRHTRRIAISRSVAAPAVRMVIVHCWADFHDDERADSLDVVVDILPVVGIESTVDDVYSKDTDMDKTPREPLNKACIKEWLDMGWRHYRESEARPLVVMDGNLMPAEDADNADTVMQTFACHWPPDADREKLGGQIADLVSAAKERAERSRQSRVARMSALG